MRLLRRRLGRFPAMTICVAMMLLFPSAAVAQGTPAALVDSTTLIAEHRRFDGQTITFIGEAIGDLMERRDGAWLNVNDDAYSRQGTEFRLAGYNRGQGVLLPKEAAAAVTRLGNYNNRGDLVRIVGVFHAACPEHGGTMMIHGQSLEVIEPGFAISHRISSTKISLATVWLVISALVLGLWRWRYHRVRRTK
jgi:hypothetical protein